MTARDRKLRKKRLIKQRESLLERAKEHRIKAETQRGEKDTTPTYWLGEAKRFEEQAKDKDEMLKKLDKKRSEANK
ncbi:hypothetical protein HY212_05750 [Candidatus Pacearchaeota archaeon]|nr:hypothetical protein [Candidatus Pacearchaeota archaeon]